MLSTSKNSQTYIPTVIPKEFIKKASDKMTGETAT